MHNVKVFIGIIILISALFTFSLVSSHYLHQSAQKLDYYIGIVERNSRSNDWENAFNELTNLDNEWKNTSNIWAMLIDHAEIDNIEDSLIRMREYIKAKNSVLTLVELASLKQYISHIPEKESFSIDNIL
ncbi:MAG TPA: DUF4363 family protein [Pseudobacteroides sp.]|nr:DUF4363 family protein [Pseudobacteroides sp.]